MLDLLCWSGSKTIHLGPTDCNVAIYKSRSRACSGLLYCITSITAKSYLGSNNFVIRNTFNISGDQLVRRLAVRSRRSSAVSHQHRASHISQVSRTQQPSAWCRKAFLWSVWFDLWGPLTRTCPSSSTTACLIKVSPSVENVYAPTPVNRFKSHGSVGISCHIN